MERDVTDRIRITGISATGHHGVFDHERRDGQTFVADVVLHVDTRPAATRDDLARTVDYGAVATDVAGILSGPPADLVETVAERIAAAVLDREAVVAVDVVVHKPQAPITVPFGDVTVEIHRDRERRTPVVPAPGSGRRRAAPADHGLADGPHEPDGGAGSGPGGADVTVEGPAAAGEGPDVAARAGEHRPGTGGTPTSRAPGAAAAGTVTGVLPTVAGGAPTVTGVLPAVAGVPPTATGVLPAVAGVPPTATALLPTATGVLPAVPGRPPTTAVLPGAPAGDERDGAVEAPAPDAPDDARQGPAPDAAPDDAPRDRLDVPPPEPVDVVLALGSNLGASEETLRRVIWDLAALDGLEVVAVSPLARTAPVGGPDQPDYLNAVVLARTFLSPRGLLRACQGVEAAHGRERLERWGPRTVDVDVVDYAGLVALSDDLELPHPRAHQRAFVLQPWAHLDPEAVLHGLGGGPVAALAQTAPDRDGVRWLALDWWGTSPGEG